MSFALSRGERGGGGGLVVVVGEGPGHEGDDYNIIFNIIYIYNIYLYI